MVVPFIDYHAVLGTVSLTKGKTSMLIKWTKVSGAGGYDIFFVDCGSNDKYKNIKTVTGEDTLSWTVTGLQKKTAYKAYVVAWYIKDGVKTYVRTSPDIHAFTSGGTKSYTNTKSVKVKKKKIRLKKGKKYKIKAKVKRLKKGKKIMSSKHARKLRYLSSDSRIATVTKSGKIKGIRKGTCYIYVYTINGARKRIKVTIY